jgi:aminoglycoside 2'-N-acetyltransferase I
MRVDLTFDRLLGDPERRVISALSDAGCPSSAARDGRALPIRWAPQTIRALVWDKSRLTCHVGALVRSAMIDGRPTPIGGIGGVVTAPDYRKRGHARAALGKMQQHLINDQRVSFLLLFCPAELCGFYERLGWRVFAGTAQVLQQDEVVAFTLNRAMVRSGTEAAPRGGTLDLRGAPW